MSEKLTDGGPAFPLSVDSGFQFANEGMSLRDWFAGQAMQMRFGRRGTAIRADEMARRCYAMADAMLAERASRAALKESTDV